MRKSMILLVGALLFLSGTASAKVLMGPYLQSMSKGEVLVCAYMQPGDKAEVVLESPGGESKTIPVQGVEPGCASAKGLSSNLEYRYRFRINGADVTESPIGFMPHSDDEQTFVIYGDTRAGDDSFDIAHRQVVRSIFENTIPDAIIHTGDFVEKGDSLPLWINFFNIEKELIATAPIFPAIGQSDHPDALMRKIFPRLEKSSYYSVDRGDAHIVVTNVWQERSQPDSEIAEDGEQARWLRADLSAARARGAKYIFVVMHEPPFSVAGKKTSAAEKVFMPIFENFQVTAVFSGAHHFSHAKVGPVHYFTNGGGGALLNDVQPSDGVYRYFNSIHHYLVLELRRGGAKLRAVNSHGEDFYMVDFDEGATGHNEDAPTFVRTFEGGDVSVPMTVYFQYGCDDCDQLKEQLPTIAKDTGVTLVATFRSLADAGNRAALAAATDAEGPTPLVEIGSDVLVGPEEVQQLLHEKITIAAAQQKPTGIRPERLIIFGIILLAGAALIAGVYFGFVRKKS